MSLQPTYRGYLATSRDEFLVLEACSNGVLKDFDAPLSENEQALIKSGDIFVYKRGSWRKTWKDRMGSLFWNKCRDEHGSKFYIQLGDLSIPEADRLIKKTTPAMIGSCQYNIISYYTPDTSTLPTPSNDPVLQHLKPQPETLVDRRSYRAETGGGVCPVLPILYRDVTDNTRTETF